jgi:ABC-type dipeptide/oligopeptide/nickel transport system permease subunit
LIRGQILSLREREYVHAARAVGVSFLRILLRHVVPNALGPVVVAATFGFSGAMVMEASLSYLGIGIQPPAASWGAMINDSLLDWRYRPWLVVVPATTLAIAALGINFLGDGLNDALNPRITQARRGR